MLATADADATESVSAVRDEYGHEWGAQVAYSIVRAEARQLAKGSESFAVASVRGRIGPGCYRCRMTWDECSDQQCPGDRPFDIDRMRQVGESHLWGRTREERRSIIRKSRKDALRRGEDPDDHTTVDPGSLARAMKRKADERVTARIRASQGMMRSADRQVDQWETKRARLAERAMVPGIAGERERKALEAFERDMAAKRVEFGAANLVACLLGAKWQEPRA